MSWVRAACALVAGLACAPACAPGGDGPAGVSSDASIDAATGVVPEGPCLTEADVVAVVFAPSCAGSACHDARRPKAGLDLATPGVAERMIGARSIHDACAERLLLVPGDPAASFLMDKVLGRQGACGDPMPELGDLDPAQRRCLAEWIASMPTAE